MLGTTGVGKSTAVALILQEILEKKANLRIFLVDPHNEYGHCFGDLPHVVKPEEPPASVLAVQFRGDRRRLLPRPPRRRGGDRNPVRADPVAKAQLRRQRARRARAAAQAVGRRLHRRHAGALPHFRSGQSHRRAHGQAREPLDLDQVPSPGHAHRDAGQRLPLRLHVQQPLRRGHDGAGAGRSLPPAGRRQADHRHAARRLPGRGGRFGRLGRLPHGLRVRRVERGLPRRCWSAARRRTATRRPTASSASDRPARRCRASPRKAANTAFSSAPSPSGRPISTRRSCRSARPSSPCAWPTTRPGDRPLGRARRRPRASSASCLARHARGDRLRRGRAAADPLPLQGCRRGSLAAQPVQPHRAARRRRVRSTTTSFARSSTAGASLRPPTRRRASEYQRWKMPGLAPTMASARR